jgi:hypothetical protein
VEGFYAFVNEPALLHSGEIFEERNEARGATLQNEGSATPARAALQKGQVHDRFS